MDSFIPIDPSRIDVVFPEHDGYPEHLAIEDTPDAMRAAAGDTARDFPDALWIEPKDWPDKARDNDKHKTWPMNYVDRYTMQDPTHECTCHSLRAIAEACRNRQRGVIYADGPKKDFRYEESGKFGSVWLSVLSIYAEANPQQWGGANIRQVMEIACERGFLPDKIQPAEYGFKHTLTGTAGKGNSNQSAGSWVPLKNFPEGWKETAAHFKPLEIIFPDSWEQAACLILHGMALGVGRNGHAIPEMQLHFDGDNLKNVGYPDSYNVTRYDSLSTFKNCARGGFSIATMTTPDDWSKPAGEMK